ncbi:MAG TPA: pitrilysin family protein [Pseudobdellovibrionaceae bacterium]|nr:pitrilysin family protein [Pseudobdellovibrionaceae bacterium]
MLRSLPRAAFDRFKYRKSTLSQGVRVVTENHPTALGVSIGIFVDKGTRDERADEAGLAHFVEHMVFKGTKSRTAFEISKDLEEVGADLNAYTSRESTCFVAHGLAETLDRQVEVLCDLISAPVFDADDLAKERDVVVQEISASEDQLEDCIYDRFLSRAFQGHSLALPILGTADSIRGMTRERVLKFFRRQYVVDNMLVAAAGRVNHEELCELLEKFLHPARAAGQRRLPAGTTPVSIVPQAFVQVQRRRAEQVHLLMGAPSPSFQEPQRFEAMFLNAILGGGLTSRLYQEIRENRGLAYSVYSHLYTFSDAGLCLMYAATEPKKAPEAFEVALGEMTKIRQSGIHREEVEMARTQLRASTLLSADDTDSRMQSLAANEMIFGRYRPVREVLKEFERVKLDGVMALAEKALQPDRVGVAMLGPIPEKPMRDFVAQELGRAARVSPSVVSSSKTSRGTRKKKSTQKTTRRKTTRR